MAWKQILSPNLDPVVYDGGKLLTDWYGECLATVETAFGAPRNFATAWAAWEGTDASLKHEDRNFPVGVYFPIWFSGAGGAGHVAFAFLNTSGHLNIWTSPYQHIPYFFSGYDSVDKLASGYGVTYVGWSEGIGLTRLIAFEPDPAPAPSTDGYTVVVAVPGYYRSNDAANRLNQITTVQPRNYSVFNRSNGMVNVTLKPGVAGAWINPADNVAPAPAPAPEPAKPANIEYWKLGTALNLVTNKQPTQVWDLGFSDDNHATAVKTLDQGAAFVAYGKAQRTDGDRPCYYMTEDDFGQADTTGAPVHNQGINTVDLSPAPAAPAPAPEVKITVVTDPGTITTSLPVDNPAPAEAPAPPAPEPVVPPAAPDTIQYTSFLNPMPYVTNKALTVQDYSGERDSINVADGTPVLVAGTFIFGGAKFYRAKSSVEKNTWYGFPVTSLTKQDPANPMEPVDIELDKIIAETDQMAANTVTHPKAIRTVATIEGGLARFLRALSLRK